MKYPKQESLRRYYVEHADLDRIHNAIKRNMDINKYQVYLKPLRRKTNNHKTVMFR